MIGEDVVLVRETMLHGKQYYVATPEGCWTRKKRHATFYSLDNGISLLGTMTVEGVLSLEWYDTPNDLEPEEVPWLTRLVAGIRKLFTSVRRKSSRSTWVLAWGIRPSYRKSLTRPLV